MQSTNPTLGMVQIVQHASWIAPPELVERILEAAGRAGGRRRRAVRSGIVIARLAMYAALAHGRVPGGAAGGAEGAGAGRRYLAGSWGWALLLMMLFSPTLFPWYFAGCCRWPGRCRRCRAGPWRSRSWRWCTSQLTTENFQLPDWMHVDLAIGHPMLVVLLVWFLRDLWLRLKYDVPLDADVDVVAVVRARRSLEARSTRSTRSIPSIRS